MERCEPPAGPEPSDGSLRRILVITGIVLVSLVLAAVAIYAAAFVMLAPMMQ